MDREEEIRKIAYRMWELEGRPEGHDLDYWLMAESIWEINNRQSELSKEKKAEIQPDSGGTEKKSV